MNELIYQLQMFDLTENEAKTYLSFLTYGAMNGYEVSKKCNIARGNIYACLERLLEKGALTKEDADKFIPIPLEIFLENFKHKLKDSHEKTLHLFNQHVLQSQDEAQVLSLLGKDAILRRSQTILNGEHTNLILLAGFSPELNFLKKEIESIQQSETEINLLSFGIKPKWLKNASEHQSEDLIEKAQGGRLLMISSFPQALIAVIREDGSGSGIWAWNRYLATAIGLYISHEIFIMKLWPMLDAEKQKEILDVTMPELGCRVTSAGVIPNLPLDMYITEAMKKRKSDGTES